METKDDTDKTSEIEKAIRAIHSNLDHIRFLAKQSTSIGELNNLLSNLQEVSGLNSKQTVHVAANLGEVEK
ncbi:hypothetical protein KAI56_01910 [Candidatus Parcubacteria bacterium]|nr:hypothetical protein [Candidatus Parcubacteria bacterium]